MLIGVLKVEVGGDKSALHHQDAVDNFARPGHPAFVARHALGAADPRLFAGKEAVEGDGFEAVALRCGGGVGIDIVHGIGGETGIVEGTLHGDERTLVAGLRDTAAVAREPIAHDFAKDVGTARHGVVVLLQHKRCTPAARHEAVAVAVEGAGGALRVVHPFGKSPQGVERGHRILVHLLRTAAEHHLLQPLTDEHAAQSDGVAAAGAGGADGEVDAAKAEDGGEVHRHGRVHRLEDVAAAEQGRVVLLPHDVGRFDDRCGGRVVAEEAAHFVAVEISLVHAGHGKGFAGGHEGIFALFGQPIAQAAVEQTFEPRALHDARQGRLIAVGRALGVDADARTTFAQGLRHFLNILAQTRPDADAGDDHSFCVHKEKG